MLVPLSDDNVLKSIPFQYVTVSLIVVNVLVFMLQSSGLDGAMISSFAVVPSELFRAGLIGSSINQFSPVGVPEQLTLLSYMFFHGDLMHLGGNMLFLWVFGDNVEDCMGHGKFLIFYLVCGAFAGFVHAFMLPDSGQALIGASGAVSGVIAAYLLLHPRVNVWVLAFKFIPLRLSAAMLLGFWILFQLVMALVPQVGVTAWWAHVGGIVAGAVLILFMRRRGVPLLDGWA